MPEQPVSPALLIIDFVNDLAFDQGRELLTHALPAARATRMLTARARAAGLPVIYVNDNHGHWHASFEEVTARCSRPDCLGRPLVEALPPGPEDYFVLKPLYSGFYGTSLEILLRRLGVRSLILTGVATDVCVLFTAGDAFMRGFDLFVPRDCVAAVEVADHRYGLGYMARVLKADTRPATALGPEAGLAGPGPGPAGGSAGA